MPGTNTRSKAAKTLASGKDASTLYVATFTALATCTLFTSAADLDCQMDWAASIAAGSASNVAMQGPQGSKSCAVPKRMTCLTLNLLQLVLAQQEAVQQAVLVDDCDTEEAAVSAQTLAREAGVTDVTEGIAVRELSNILVTPVPLRVQDTSIVHNVLGTADTDDL
eukprot:11370-Heterococcus_DN1.PRE.5